MGATSLKNFRTKKKQKQKQKTSELTMQSVQFFS